jgi:hypothetical protein
MATNNQETKQPMVGYWPNDHRSHPYYHPFNAIYIFISEHAKTVIRPKAQKLVCEDLLLAKAHAKALSQDTLCK